MTLLDQVCVLDNAGSAQFFLTFSSRYSGEQAVVRLINGSEPGVNTTRVSSADIWLNRQKLWGPSDFQGDISQLETTVNLAAGQNILIVHLDGNPGTSINIEVAGSQLALGAPYTLIRQAANLGVRLSSGRDAGPPL